MRIHVAVAAVLAASALMADAARADNFFYTVACLRNETTFNIAYHDSQNDGKFTPSNLSPGQTMVYKLKYAKVNQHKGLKVVVSFDADGSNKKFNRKIKLAGYAATGESCREGKQYAFRPEPRDARMIRIQNID